MIRIIYFTIIVVLLTSISSLAITAESIKELSVKSDTSTVAESITASRENNSTSGDFWLGATVGYRSVSFGDGFTERFNVQTQAVLNAAKISDGHLGEISILGNLSDLIASTDADSLNADIHELMASENGVRFDLAYTWSPTDYWKSVGPKVHWLHFFRFHAKIGMKFLSIRTEGSTEDISLSQFTPNAGLDWTMPMTWINGGISKLYLSYGWPIINGSDNLEAIDEHKYQYFESTLILPMGDMMGLFGTVRAVQTRGQYEKPAWNFGLILRGNKG